MNEPEITKVWDLLYSDRATSFAGAPYMVHWFASRPDQTARMGDYALSVNELVSAAKAAEAQEMNFYVQMNASLKRGGMRSRGEDITHWNYFVLDVDPKAEDAEPFNALEEYMLFLYHRIGLRLRPHVVYSGRGVQAWLPIRPAIPTHLKHRLTQGDELIWEGRVGDIIGRAQAYWLRFTSERVGLIHGCQLDPAVSDLPRVMRCPGTLNVKSGKHAMLMHEGVYTPGLSDALLNYAPARTIAPPAPPVYAGDHNWQFYMPLLNWSASRYLTTGGKAGSRHDDAVKAAKNLMEVGCSAEEAMEALKWGNKISQPEPLGAPELEQILRSVYKTTRIVV